MLFILAVDLPLSNLFLYCGNIFIWQNYNLFLTAKRGKTLLINSDKGATVRYSLKIARGTTEPLNESHQTMDRDFILNLRRFQHHGPFNGNKSPKKGADELENRPTARNNCRTRRKRYSDMAL